MYTTFARGALICAVLTCQGTSPATQSNQGKQGTTVVGLLLGGLTDETRSAASGGVFEYDGPRQAERTRMKASEIAGSEASGAKADETVGDVGHRHLQDLLGDWKIDVWVRVAEDQRMTATGSAKVVQADDNSVRILYRDITVQADDRRLNGYSLLSYDPGEQFELENGSDTTDEVLNFVGEYLANENAYYFYLMSESGEPVKGKLRSIVLVKLRISSPGLWVAETYSVIDGEEVQVQSYRFSKS